MYPRRWAAFGRPLHFDADTLAGIAEVQPAGSQKRGIRFRVLAHQNFWRTGEHTLRERGQNHLRRTPVGAAHQSINPRKRDVGDLIQAVVGDFDGTQNVLILEAKRDRYLDGPLPLRHVHRPRLKNVVLPGDLQVLELHSEGFAGDVQRNRLLVPRVDATRQIAGFRYEEPKQLGTLQVVNQLRVAAFMEDARDGSILGRHFDAECTVFQDSRRICRAQGHGQGQSHHRK